MNVSQFMSSGNGKSVVLTVIEEVGYSVTAYGKVSQTMLKEVQQPAHATAWNSSSSTKLKVSIFCYTTLQVIRYGFIIRTPKPRKSTK